MKKLKNLKKSLANTTALFLVLFWLCATVVPVAEANTVLRSGESVSIASDQIVEGDFYVLTGTGSLSGTVNGDMQVVAGAVTANGSVTGDVLILAGSVQHHATVTDDVRIIAGDVTIAESIGGDLIVVGGVLKVLSTASIAGDILFFGGDAEIKGPVGGSILGVSERLRIDSTVGEEVDVTTGQLILGDRAAITEGVSYISNQELVRATDAVVAGEVVRNTVSVNPEFDIAGAMVLPYLILMFASLVAYLFFKHSLFRIIAGAISHPVPTLLIGAATTLVLPTIIVALVAVTLGLLLGVFFFGAMIFFYTMAMIVAGAMTGALVYYAVTKQIRVDLISVAGGTTLLYVLLLVPVINVLITIAVFIFCLGAILRHLYHQLFTN